MDSLVEISKLLEGEFDYKKAFQDLWLSGDVRGAQRVIVSQLLRDQGDLEAHEFFNQLNSIRGNRGQLGEEIELVIRTFPVRGGIVDIGSNVGAFSHPLLSAGFKVLSIEPNPDCIALQKEFLIPFFNAGRVAFEAVAASDTEEAVELHVSDDTEHAFSSLETSWSKDYFPEIFAGGKKVQVRTAIGSKLIKYYQQFLTPLQLVKIDVEGAELKVVRGLLLDGAILPKMVMFEFHTIPEVLENTINCIRLLEKAGYSKFKYFIRHGENLIIDTEWLSGEKAVLFPVHSFTGRFGKILEGLRFGNVIAHKE